MLVFTSTSSRTKKVSDPFNENFRARILNFSGSESSYISSGSEHDGDSEIMSSPSPCLSHLVQNFLENDTTTTTTTTNTTAPLPAVPESMLNPSDDSDDDEEAKPSTSNPDAVIRNIINPIVRNNADRFRNELVKHVSKAVEMFSFFKRDKSMYNRNIMAYLRQIGYNAGLCKTKWEATPGGGLTAGSYEFIDVMKPAYSLLSSNHSNGGGVRYFIDVDFAEQFEIARETDSYRKLLSSLPSIFVGKMEELKRLVRLMSDETRRSIRCSGLTMPPWRKNRYMQSKWFGPYRRTLNQVSTSTATITTTTDVTNLTGIKSRHVGFDTAVGTDSSGSNNGGFSGGAGRFFVAPPAIKYRRSATKIQ